MALNKVEICGVDTSKLPLLRKKRKMHYLQRLRQEMRERKSNI